MTMVTDKELVGHIIYPSVEVGEKALTLCGRKLRVRVTAADLDSNGSYLCRDCVDQSVLILSETDNMAYLLADALDLVGEVAGHTREVADKAESMLMGSLLVRTVAQAEEYQQERAAKVAARIEKAQRQAEKAEAKAWKEMLAEEKAEKKAKKAAAKKAQPGAVQRTDTKE